MGLKPRKDYYKPQKQSSRFTFAKHKNAETLNKRPAGWTVHVIFCVAVRRCVLVQSESVSPVSLCNLVSVWSYLAACVAREEPQLSSVFADTLSAEQTHEDCVTRECVSLRRPHPAEQPYVTP